MRNTLLKWITKKSRRPWSCIAYREHHATYEARQRARKEAFTKLQEDIDAEEVEEQEEEKAAEEEARNVIVILCSSPGEE